MMKVIKPLLAVVVALLAWELAVRVLNIQPYILPSPLAVVERFVGSLGFLAQQALPTLLEIWVGFVLAVVAGFALAIPIAYSRNVEDTAFPILVAFEVVPKVALAPLLIIWLGFGIEPKIVIAALIAFFPIVVNSVRGLRSVDPEFVQWCTSLGATKPAIFWKLSLPWAMPYIFAAMRVSIAAAVVGAVVGEFVGTDRGLGFVIMQTTSSADTTGTFAALLSLGIVGMLSFQVIVVAERLYLRGRESGHDAFATV